MNGIQVLRLFVTFKLKGVLESMNARLYDREECNMESLILSFRKLLSSSPKTKETVTQKNKQSNGEQSDVLQRNSDITVTTWKT